MSTVPDFGIDARKGSGVEREEDVSLGIAEDESARRAVSIGLRIVVDKDGPLPIVLSLVVAATLSDEVAMPIVLAS